jgi:hypothetical protein
MARRNNKNIFKIRRRYEYGEDLNKLALEYKMPLSTINKRKAADADKGNPWIKGCKTLLAFKAYDEGIEARKKELCSKIEDEAREMLFHVRKLKADQKSRECLELEFDEEGVGLVKSQEESYKIRLEFIDKYTDLRKKIEGIKSEEELEQYEARKLSLEFKKLEIEEKRLNLKIKKAENARLLRRLENNGTNEDVSKMP